MTRLKSYKSIVCNFVPKITKRSINCLADPEYSVITKPADSPDQTAPLGEDCSWIISFAQSCNLDFCHVQMYEGHFLFS